ncbi:hypothetical protein GCM10009733_029240 [Nonomuraea maheshkhaliensis]|uniref:Uncharacterized protein n=1 Tax=Nonomuraea maheshkhaliensis TaxID=419590 RepID=A0ABP4R4X6_9ACTN
MTPSRLIWANASQPAEDFPTPDGPDSHSTDRGTSFIRPKVAAAPRDPRTVFRATLVERNRTFQVHWIYEQPTHERPQGTGRA